MLDKYYTTFLSYIFYIKLYILLSITLYNSVYKLLPFEVTMPNFELPPSGPYNSHYGELNPVQASGTQKLSKQEVKQIKKELANLGKSITEQNKLVKAEHKLLTGAKTPAERGDRVQQIEVKILDLKGQLDHLTHQAYSGKPNASINRAIGKVKEEINQLEKQCKALADFSAEGKSSHASVVSRSSGKGFFHRLFGREKQNKTYKI